MMEDSTPSRPLTKYRRYMWDPTAPIPRSTLSRYRKRAAEFPAHEDDTRLRRRLSLNMPPALDSPPETIHSLAPSPSSLAHSSPVSTPSAHSSPEPSPSSLAHSSPESTPSAHSSPEPSPSSLAHSSPESTPSAHSSPEPSPSSLAHSSPESTPSAHSSPEPSPSSDQSSPEPVSQSPTEPSSHSSSSDPLSDPQLFAPLYPGAKITLCGALCAIMHFCIANKLSFTAIGDLLKLLSVLCPFPNLLPSSFYKFKRFFQQFHSVHNQSEICLKCQGNTKDACSCGNLSQDDKANIVHLEIKKPLEKIIADNWGLLREPSRSESDGNILRDVWDGSALRSLCSRGRFFSDRNNLALSLSTDGVPLYKSSGLSLWPVYLVILNLPAQVRMNAENVILCGIWVGRVKPIVNLLLKPITKFLRGLSTLGVVIRTPLGYSTVRAKLAMGIFDLPAKAAVLCAKQFNGKFGCSVCLHPGTRLSNNSRIYLPDKVYPQRTHAQVIAAAKEAEGTNSCIRGIMCTTPFASTLDVVNCIPVDYMHAVLEGVTRWLMRSWFDSKHHAEPYYIGRQVTNIDEHLLKICPPSEFSRPPRSIKKHLKYWKASEFRNWLLFYSLPILVLYLPPLFWHHFALLVCSMHIMLSDCITQEMLSAAEQMIVDFCLLLPQLYGRCSCTANAHLLTHLAKYVRLWGPLWTHSAFGFENKNGRLKHLFHGNYKIFHQLLFNVDVTYTLQTVHTRLNECESTEVLEYLNHSTSKRRRAQIGERTYVIGLCKVISASMEQSTALRYSGNIEVFFRLLKCGVLYHCTSYSRGTTGKRNNTYCCYRQNSDNSLHFGQIELFTTTPQPHALVRELRPCGTTIINQAGHPCRPVLLQYQEADLLSMYIVQVNTSTEDSPLVAVSIANVVSKLVVLSVSDCHYCIVQPNSVERH